MRLSVLKKKEGRGSPDSQSARTSTDRSSSRAVLRSATARKSISGAESRAGMESNNVEKLPPSSTSQQLGFAPSQVKQELQQVHVMLGEQQAFSNHLKQQYARVEEAIKLHKNCHEEAFTAITNEMKKRCEQQTLIETLHGEINKLASRIGYLEVEQFQFKQLLQKHSQEVQQWFGMHPVKGCISENIGFDASTNSLGSFPPRDDSRTSTTISADPQEESGNNEKLSALLRDLREERACVADILENVQQEKIDVISAMHTFQLEKINAMQEIEAAQNKTPSNSNRRKDRVIASNPARLSIPFPLSTRQIADPLGKTSGARLVSMPAPGSSEQAAATAAKVLLPIPKRQHSPGLVNAVPLLNSCSSGAVFRPQSPSVPQKRMAGMKHTMQARVTRRTALPRKSTQVRNG